MKNKKENSRIRIVPLEPEDGVMIEETAKLEAKIFPDPWSCQEVGKTVRGRHTFCASAKEGDTLLGYLLCYYVLDECEIARIAVDAWARRRGIGQMLLAYLEEFCRDKGIARILLDVRRSNQAAICFYEKNGFGVDGMRKGYYGGKEPEDAVLMSRIL